MPKYTEKARGYKDIYKGWINYKPNSFKLKMKSKFLYSKCIN